MIVDTNLGQTITSTAIKKDPNCWIVFHGNLQAFPTLDVEPVLAAGGANFAWMEVIVSLCCTWMKIHKYDQLFCSFWLIMFTPTLEDMDLGVCERLDDKVKSKGKCERGAIL